LLLFDWIFFIAGKSPTVWLDGSLNTDSYEGFAVVLFVGGHIVPILDLLSIARCCFEELELIQFNRLWPAQDCQT